MAILPLTLLTWFPTLASRDYKATASSPSAYVSVKERGRRERCGKGSGSNVKFCQLHFHTQLHSLLASPCYLP